MIRLERPPAPAIFGLLAGLRSEALEWSLAASRGRTDAIEQTFGPTPRRVLDDARESLIEAQHGKCAFCETFVLSTKRGDTALFRPRRAAMGTEGDSSLGHYGWLAYEWENLHFTCGRCNRLKGPRFPVDGDRCVIGAPWDEVVRTERALLIDPYLEDPSEHLVFSDDGTCSGRTDRGLTSITVFGLNRRDLVNARRRAIDNGASHIQLGVATRELSSEIQALTAPDREYSQAVRQAVARVAESLTELTAEPAAPTVTSSEATVTIEGIHLPRISPAEERKAVKGQRRLARAQATYTLSDSGGSPTYYSSAKYVEAVTIRNWKGIRDLRLEAPSTGTAEQAPWLMLLGENGCGKSSILQGIALALIGRAERSRLRLRASDFVRNGEDTATVEVWLSNIPEPMVVRARRGDSRFGGTGAEKVLVLGFGSTRLLPTKRVPARAVGGSSTTDVVNLFDPFSPLTPPVDWLLQLDKRAFRIASRALRHLLGLKPSEGLRRDRASKTVRCQLLGAVVPLNQLSDGYQSVVAVSCHILAVLLDLWDDASAAEGIVILDEMGAQLHPRWRMRVVETIRAVFPRVQFLTSTHEPLCLRGLQHGEVARLERSKGPGRNVVVQQALPDVAGLRVDQLLTSELFGLRSTMDPAIERAFDEYYDLLAARELSDADTARLEELREELARREQLGETRRERLVFEAADRWLAQQRSAAVPAPDHEAVDLLTTLWDRGDLGPSGGPLR